MGEQGEQRESGLDVIARDLATGEISRRTALKRFALVAATAAIPGGIFASSALANCPKSQKCGEKCCPKHSHCIHKKCKCRNGYSKCGKRCRNLQTDVKNCGSCGHACASGESCIAGKCRECTAAAECPQAAAGSCQKAVCSAGACGFVADDTNLPVDGNQCTQDACTGGVPSNPPLNVGATCNQSGGVHCDGFGNCVAASCVNAIKDGDETDVDCGGSCPGCANGKSCQLDTDCLSSHCVGGSCVQCASASNCPGSDTICQQRSCTAGACGTTFTGNGTTCSASSCVNPTTQQNAGQCDGAGACQPGGTVNCAPYVCSGTGCKTSCAVPADCASGFTCAASVCKKADGQTCTGGGECASGNCVDGFCCNTPCTGNCSACSSALKNGVDGVCGNMPNGVACKGGSGTCNGAGVCSV